MKQYIFDREKDDFIRDEDGDKIPFISNDEAHWYLAEECQFNKAFIDQNFYLMKAVKILHPEKDCATKFICTSESHDALDHKGNKIGVQEKRALFYLTSIGRRRTYRRGLFGNNKGFRILDFKTRETAQDLCSQINEVYNDDFKVEALPNSEQEDKRSVARDDDSSNKVDKQNT